jgi:hypothetical protein
MAELLLAALLGDSSQIRSCWLIQLFSMQPQAHSDNFAYAFGEWFNAIRVRFAAVRVGLYS